jgi:hypothetical protein
MSKATALLPVLLSSGCALFGGLHVETLGSGAQRPGNVAAYVAVSDGDEPVTELAESDFAVYENEQLVPAQQTQAKLLDRELSGAYRTLLLVDLGFAATPEGRRELGSALSVFVEKVRASQAVTVFGFDGGPTLKLLAEVSKGDGPSNESFRLPSPGASDGSRNLNGAVQRALNELDTRLAQSRKPIRIGTLVVFANGPDLAGRTSENELETALDEHHPVLLSIGVGEHAPPALRALGRDGFFAAQSADAVAMAFEEASYRVRSEYERHYLFSYCSPSRAGTRRLRLEVRFTDKKGSEKKGDAEAEFDARGFGPGCDPRSVPPISSPERAEKKSRDKSAPRSDAQPEKPPGKSNGSTPRPSEPQASPEGDEGVVVPPPKRSGYAQ